MTVDLDDLDRKILEYLQVDSRRPFLEIARNLKVSGGTIHARVNRLKELGVIQGSKIVIDYKSIGFHVTAFVGIRLAQSTAFRQIQDQLQRFPEIIELHCTTGEYSLLAKVVVGSVADLYQLLSDKLLQLDGIQSTETAVVLHTPLLRDPAVHAD